MFPSTLHYGNKGDAHVPNVPDGCSYRRVFSISERKARLCNAFGTLLFNADFKVIEMGKCHSSAQFASVHALGSNQQIFFISIKNSLFNVETGNVHKVREMGRKEKHKIMGAPIFLCCRRIDLEESDS